MGAITNNQSLCNLLIKSGEETGDRVWQLPNFPDYAEAMKGTYADLQNQGDGVAGTITAGSFLENFVNNIPWVHLDIAGTAWGVKNIEYHPNKGATGTGVRLLINSLENLSEWNH